MLRITLKKAQGGVYWAVCEKVSHVAVNTYLLERITEASEKPGPCGWDITPPDWKILCVEGWGNGSEE